MDISEIIENLITREVRGLCMTCVHANACIYHQTATRDIIQCELYQLDVERTTLKDQPQGLCKSCDNAANCKLPGRAGGVWHCNEFE